MVTNVDRALIEYLTGDGFSLTKAGDVEFSYISNPDGTIRWLYPKKLKYPSFLSFYSTSSFRAKMLSYIIRLAFFTKQSHLVKSGDLNVDISENSRLGKILKEYSYTGFSVFTGTIGENRKAVIEVHEKQQPLAFIKIALTEAAKLLVENEARCLEHINTYEFNSMVVPKILSNNKQHTIAISNIKPQKFQQKSKLTELHVNALSELYIKSNSQIKWIELASLHESKELAENLLNDFKIPNELHKSRIQNIAKKIILLINMLEENEDEVTVAISHGDFTPWNMYSSKNVLHLFDWELSEDNTPLMFDFFHFIFQSEVMVKHSTYNGIYSECERFLKTNNVLKLSSDFNIDINKNYIFYLVCNISYYLSKYIKQKELHQQVFWLIDVWEDAVNDVINKKGVVFEN